MEEYPRRNIDVAPRRSMDPMARRTQTTQQSVAPIPPQKRPKLSFLKRKKRPVSAAGVQPIAQHDHQVAHPGQRVAHRPINTQSVRNPGYAQPRRTLAHQPQPQRHIDPRRLQRPISSAGSYIQASVPQQSDRTQSQPVAAEESRLRKILKLVISLVIILLFVIVVWYIYINYYA